MIEYETPPRKFIAEELQAREWNNADLAFVTGWSPNRVSRLVTGHTSITPASANVLSFAFGVSAEYILNLQRMYDLSRTKKASADISRRARMVSAFPIREMIRRGWLNDTDVDSIESQLAKFFCVNSVEEALKLPGKIA